MEYLIASLENGVWVMLWKRPSTCHRHGQCVCGEHADTTREPIYRLESLEEFQIAVQDSSGAVLYALRRLSFFRQEVVVQPSHSKEGRSGERHEQHPENRLRYNTMRQVELKGSVVGT